MPDSDSCCPPGATICCSAPAGLACSGAGLRCRFGGGVDVPARLCGSTICCEPPAALREQQCLAVLDGDGTLLFRSPGYCDDAQPAAEAGAPERACAAAATTACSGGTCCPTTAAAAAAGGRGSSSSTAPASGGPGAMPNTLEQQQPGGLDLDACVSALLAESRDIARLALDGSTVLYRADLNVPLTDSGDVADATRLTSILPTLRLLLAKGARVALASHLGRPQPGKQSAQQMAAAFSLAPVGRRLAQELADLPGAFCGLAPDCVGPSAVAAVDALQPGQVVLLENLRFHAGEGANDPSFAAALASLADVYINDAFGVSHRDQASVTGVVPHISRAYPGLLLRNELRFLHAACATPARPFGVIIGGAKVRDKIGVLQSLLAKADVLLVGGRMAWTFLAAAGVSVGATQIEQDWLEPCREMMQLAAQRGVELLLPQDAVVARSMDDDHGCCTVVLTPNCCSPDAPCVPHGCYGLDIGPKTAAAFTAAILRCRTLLWNGPMGRFEVPGFAAGTEAVARAMGAATEAGSTTVVGGGDSVSAVNRLSPVPAMSFISTGGGASLELIRGDLLPGIRALAQAAGADGGGAH